MGDISNTQRLLAHPDILVNQSDCKGETALICAAKNSQIDTIELLLADPRLIPEEHDQ